MESVGSDLGSSKLEITKRVQHILTHTRARAHARTHTRTHAQHHTRNTHELVKSPKAKRTGCSTCSSAGAGTSDKVVEIVADMMHRKHVELTSEQKNKHRENNRQCYCVWSVQFRL